MIQKFYKTFEEKYSSALRVLLVLATLGTLLFAGYTAMSGYIASRTEANLKTDVDATSFSVVEDLLFKKQIEEIEEEEEDGDEAEEKKVPEYVKTIHTSIGKHFQDARDKKELFKEEFTAETLELILGLIKTGQWKVGNSGGGYQIDLPVNPWSCIPGMRTTALNDQQFAQLITHLTTFWSNAEKGTDTNSSQFNKTIDFDGRLGQILSANDLMICSFNASLAGLDAENNAREMEAQGERMAGGIMIALAGSALDMLFKFFASFALVVIALILYRIFVTVNKR